MYHLNVENIRCFFDKHELMIKPITVIIGENSTGKTTILALINCIKDIVLGIDNVDLFNKAPFNLGSYHQIASRIDSNEATTFSVGINRRVNDALCSINAEFRQSDNNYRLKKWTLLYKDSYFIIESEGKTRKHVIKIRGKELHVDKHPMLSLGESHNIDVPQLFSILPFLVSASDQIAAVEKKDKNFMITNKSTIKDLSSAYMAMLAEFNNPIYPYAPIRIKPERTYNPQSNVTMPDGTHVASVLNSKHKEASKNQNQPNHALFSELNEYGKKSKLFTEIKVSVLGKEDDSPFQLQVSYGGKFFNIVDVGYGVHQILPILVDSITLPNNSTLIIQQPEVHLHPIAQAELGTFLVQQHNKSGKNYIIETHSDYIIDRLRIEVKRKNISTDDICILFFQKEGQRTTVHEIKLDNYGNIVSTPNNYRDFFVDESLSLIGD